jgi:signal transduction histidine kinase
MSGLKELTRSLLALADVPNLDDEEILQRRFLIVTATAMSIGGIVWGVLCLLLGLATASVVPFGYTVITAGNLTYLHLTKRFPVARAIQVVISLLLPFLLQWKLGGFGPSGAVAIWALLTLAASQSFGSMRTSLKWLAFFIGLIGVSVVIEPDLKVPPEIAHPSIARYSLIINVTVVSIAIFVLISYFLQLRHRLSQELAAKHRELMESRQALIQSEKMASLGRLSAGLAHELNNPSSAVQRGASRVGGAVSEMCDLTFALGREGIDAAQSERIEQIDDQAKRRSVDSLGLGAMERMDREEEIQQWIEGHQVPGLRSHVSGIVDLGLTPADLDELAGVFTPDILQLVLIRSGLTSTVDSLLGEIKRGAERVSAIVKALRSYSYMDRDQLQSVDVNEGLDDTLLMLHSRLKKGIVVERDYDTNLPAILASGGELNQVWTNLIDNAADAMEESGALTVRTRGKDDHVVVEIIDSGPGIPPEVCQRLFDPFVTSKPVGVGTGLGLSISHNIVVKKHAGSIDVQSRPGHTCFTVRLPIKRAATSEPVAATTQEEAK